MAAAAGRALRRHKLLTHKKLQSSVVGSLKQGFCVVGMYGTVTQVDVSCDDQS